MGLKKKYPKCIIENNTSFKNKDYTNLYLTNYNYKPQL